MEEPKIIKYIKSGDLHISKIKNPTHEMCMAAIIHANSCNKRGFVLKYIKNQTEDMCKIAVQKNGFNLEYVRNPTVEVCIIAIKTDNASIHFVKTFHLFTVEDIQQIETELKKYYHILNDMNAKNILKRFKKLAI
jgi:hypothetical protein